MEVAHEDIPCSGCDQNAVDVVQGLQIPVPIGDDLGLGCPPNRKRGDDALSGGSHHHREVGSFPAESTGKADGINRSDSPRHTEQDGLAGERCAGLDDIGVPKRHVPATPPPVKTSSLRSS